MSLPGSFFAPLKTHYDVVIVGGAKIGSSVAWFLSNNTNFNGSKVISVSLATGEEILCETDVNASGPRAALTSRMAGIDIPFEADDFIEDHTLWQDKMWPAIAKRIPQFESIKLINSWVGHYAYNTLDQNAILGAHKQVENFIFVNGFSGHGFQQAPTMGRGAAELITYGEYRTLDLTPFGYQRVAEHKPFTEHVVI